MNEELRKSLVNLAMAMYIDEPCRICGSLITSDDLHNLVWAGYSKGYKSRSAHRLCWKKYIDKSNWFHPEDST